MQLPIDDKDLDTIISALSLGGDTRLYFLLKNVRDDNKLKEKVAFRSWKYISDSADENSANDWEENVHKGNKLFQTILYRAGLN